MLIVISGKNTFSSLKKLAQLRKAFQEKFDPSGMNTHDLEVKKNNLGEARQVLLSQGFLSDRRFAVLRGLFEAITTKPEYSKWLDLLSSLPDDVICILFSRLPQEKLSKLNCYKAVKKIEGLIEYPFPTLSSSQLRTYMQNEMSRLQLSLSAAQISDLMSGTNNDIWAISCEIQKLAAVSGGHAVNDELFAAISSTSAEDDIFSLMDAVSEKKQKRALDLLRLQRMYGSSDMQLLAMLIRQSRLLLQAKSASMHPEDASSIGAPPFLRNKLMKQAAGFNQQHLLQLHEDLYRSEEEVKTGRLSAELAVDRVVASMLTA